MTVVVTKLFLNNKTQAVRLPKDVAFPDDVSEVEILVDGDARVIVPKGRRLEYYFSHQIRLPDDVEWDRDQPPMQERAWLD